MTDSTKPPDDAMSAIAAVERDALLTPRKMTPEVAKARKELLAARSALEEELDGLTDATRSALDIPAKVRRNPVKSVALAGGAGFLLLGGPRRVLRAATSRFLPPKRDPYDGLLPDEVERILRDFGAYQEPGVREALEADFADYLRGKGRQPEPPSARKSLWRTYDALVGPLGTVAARLLVERLMAADRTGVPPAVGRNGSRSRAETPRLSWCGRGDSNPHAFRHWLLRPACLPFHHSRASAV